MQDRAQAELDIFLSEVCIYLVPQLYDTGEIMMAQGTYCKEMMFVTSGLVARMGRLFGKRTVLGEDAILRRTKRYYTVVSVSYVQVEIITGEQMYDIIHRGALHIMRDHVRFSAFWLCFRRFMVNVRHGVEKLPPTGQTPLMLAASKGHASVVVALLQAGNTSVGNKSVGTTANPLDLMKMDAMGMSAMHIAASCGSTEVVKAMLAGTVQHTLGTHYTRVRRW
jgi:hypothetical protein